jgi:uncharacterized membrane protein required for colicin V production
LSLGVFDLVTLGVGAVGYLLGRSRGLLWQASGLLTLIGGGLCATVLSRPLGHLFAAGVAGRFVAWLAVYVVVAVCLYVLTLKFKARIKELEYEELDWRFGGLFGVIKGLTIFALITLIAAGVTPRIAGPVKASYAGQALRAIVHELRPLVPEQVHEAFGPWLDAVDEPPPVTQAPTRWPERDAPQPPPTTTSQTAPPPAPPPIAPRPPVLEREVELEPPPRTPRRDPPPPAADPFDTSRDPPDPLAPPRQGR